MKHLFKSTLILLAIFLPTIALAYDFEVNGIYYNVNGNQATVTYKTTNYNSYSGNVTIPETINYSGTEYQVTAIGASAFRKSSSLTKVTIPNSITSIGSYAFYQCGALTNIIIPNSVTSVDDAAFYGCIGINDLVIGNSVTSIGESAFYECSGLKNIEIPNSVTSIGSNAFYRCKGLNSIEIPNSVETIGGSAFYDCDALKSVIIGESVNRIGGNAFTKCDNLSILYFNAINCQDFFSNSCPFKSSPLSTIIIGDHVTRVPDYFTYYYSNYDGSFATMASLKNLIIGNSVTYIGAYAFRGCKGLSNIEFPNTVTTIGDYAFCNCYGLNSIVLPNSIATIRSCAFYYCTGLRNITIGNSITTIGDFAFCGCSELTSISLGNSLTTIGAQAFNYCNLNTIYITGDGEWKAGALPCNNQITTLCIGSGITAIKGLKVNPLNIYCYATTPPTCDNNTFTTYRGTLHVPVASLSSYFVAPIWENFSYILGDAQAVQSVKLSDNALNMILADEEQLTASVQPTGARPNDIIWSSSNSSIATVADGLVTAVGVGECDIIASCFDKRAICHVTVRDSIAVILDIHEAQLLPNHILMLNPTVIPVATGITVISSDPTVAAARVVNNQVQVVGVKEGTTVITVGSSNGTAQVDTCLVTVYTEPGDVNCDGYIDINDVTGLIDYVLTGNSANIKTANADYNNDSFVDINDITALIDHVLGK